MSRAEQATNRPTVVRDGAVAHVLLWTCFPLLGAAAGWVLSMVPGWLAALPEWVHALPMVPGREQVDLLAGLDGPVLTAVLSAVGLGAGALLALLSYGDMVVVEVGDGGVRITRGGRGRRSDATVSARSSWTARTWSSSARTPPKPPASAPTTAPDASAPPSRRTATGGVTATRTRTSSSAGWTGCPASNSTRRRS
ncbi:hypothetical protein HFP72_29200 [Nocardiopsis sp. ARC36]